ncbi:MAG: hypothetical protein FJ033_03260 [Chloroflexi bacterium]|nr:hypothetical protein [Chloroflexota bacterium]
MTSSKSSHPAARWKWGLPAALALALGLIVVTTISLPPAAPGQSLTAERTGHAFGNVRMQDGPLRTSFPLAIRTDVTVTDLGTT